MNLLQKVREHYLLILILIFASILLSINLNKPFIGHHDYNGAVYSSIARNYLRYGFIKYHFAQIQTEDFTDPIHFEYLTHHPPLLTILMAISFKIFGISEQSARLVPLVSSLLTLISIYLLSIKFFDKNVATLATLIASIIPIFIYYGKMPVQDVIVLPFILFSVYFYFKFLVSRNLKDYIFLIFFIIAGNMTAWPAYYQSLIFTIHYLFFGFKKNKLIISISFVFISVLTFSIHLINVFLSTKNFFGGGLDEIFFARLNLRQIPTEYSLKNLILLQIDWSKAFYTKYVIILSILSFIFSIFNFKNIKRDLKLQILSILLLIGISHILIFRNVAYYHDYILIYLLPFLTISSGITLSVVSNFKKFNLTGRSLIVAVVVFAIFFDKLQFTKVLLQTKNFSEGVDLGKYINQNTKSQDKVLILSPDFKHYFEGFTEFYADRKLTYQLIDPLTLETIIDSRKYVLIIAIPERDTKPELINYLNSHLKSNEYQDKFLIFSYPGS